MPSPETIRKLLLDMGLRQVTARGKNIMACCPFHSERSPSWGIQANPPHLHACFSCGAKGGLRHLLTEIGNFPKEEIDAICVSLSDFGVTHKGLSLSADSSPVAVSEEELFPFMEFLPLRARKYLAGRGIGLSTIKRCGLMFDKKQKRILFPWKKDGKLLGVTGRAIDDSPYKTLPYAGTKKGNWLYLPLGKIHFDKPLVFVEGEIDALSLVEVGFDNVAALGFGKITERQFKFALEAAPSLMVFFFDNDLTGQRITESAKNLALKFLKPYSEVSEYYGYKDAAEMPPDLRKSAVEKSFNWLDLSVDI